MTERSLPLIRETADGWERLEIGTAHDPRYAAYAWDQEAWEARQRAAEGKRRALILETPLVRLERSEELV